MIIHLEVDYVSDYVFWPVYSLDGRLIAVEMVSRFNDSSGDLSMPSDILFTLINKEQGYDLIHEYILFIEDKAGWFSDNRILLVLRTDYEIVDLFMQSAGFCDLLRRFDFVRLAINEDFPGLSQGKENAVLVRMSQTYNLWLDNFGGGKSNLKSLHDGLLSGVKMDPHFVEHLLSRSPNTLIMEALLRNIKSYYQGVMIIVKGINTACYFHNIKRLNIDAVQGELWPAVHFDELKKQIKLP
ncbi:EAL domain-containing protein (putative c-di-GMP-specific phosphodiesterase class I)|uniref:EAL domain-containing protein (Putative c-di-GMP-specific phosphodiesterase class I) n=1 Tax=Brenneria salicis ATCC 15712 = DSM 30166 TaxID=714314 RepID=A0A366I4A0_9GAMM|nr:EAL domain-containing protein [Brenneria salicis]NMN91945.1 EAL domain-containing protein (putative c-di-GMP-specific phosphodiesterase class I) [Brenneria salicis ATCC 15712 = DSM 30166]RBP62834.1 EAL domain-containing protein (putative c-di-GMP-specific phosphodiesterase class I) [Brenneria salicis ATCC 15712 = DSM 30166]RLM30708.1 diguanylate phosphodiesterase [Brenneria salicis ATCC 15712 = DSM 30166]